jgi:hypothetical protein
MMLAVFELVSQIFAFINFQVVAGAVTGTTSLGTAGIVIGVLGMLFSVGMS